MFCFFILIEQIVSFCTHIQANFSYFVKTYNNSCLNSANYTGKAIFLTILPEPKNKWHECQSWQIPCLGICHCLFPEIHKKRRSLAGENLNNQDPVESHPFTLMSWQEGDSQAKSRQYSLTIKSKDRVAKCRRYDRCVRKNWYVGINIVGEPSAADSALFSYTFFIADIA